MRHNRIADIDAIVDTIASPVPARANVAGDRQETSRQLDTPLQDRSCTRQSADECQNSAFGRTQLRRAASKPLKWIGFVAAGPDFDRGELIAEHLRQYLYGKPLTRIVARQEQRDVGGFGFQTGMETGFSSHQ